MGKSFAIAFAGARPDVARGSALAMFQRQSASCAGNARQEH
jgi:hypothetical protein